MRWLRATFLPASLLLLGAAGMMVPLPAYVESPGRIVPLAACVVVDDESATAVEGDFLLMTVTVLRASTFDAVVAGLDPDQAVVSQEQVVPAGVDTRTYFTAQREVFNLVRDLAVAVGMQAAGQPADIDEAGVRVLHIAPGTPAAAALRPNDVITEIDGESVLNAAALREAVARSEGQSLNFRVRRDERDLSVELAPVVRAGSRVVGIIPETVIDVQLPFGVDVASGSVGGPSAGLMIALTVYDKVLPGVDVAAGRTIAGTGTIDEKGRVGPVGGAGLKVIAAVRAGADVFLVPAVNAPEARAALPDGADMEIIEVTTFDSARTALERSSREARDGAPITDRCPYQQT